ncbi:MAG: extracellular solute-binding protein [Treponema sp.]|jgi:raffinose/stachyose/melibiose transport system substrate-binding protein|nr:extracellular solute-binding protein [Treponema sp.]
MGLRRRYAALLIAAAISTLALGSCKKEDGGNSGKVTLSVLNYLDMTSANSVNEVETVWGAFDQANPGIQVVREDLYNEPYHNKVEVYAATGKLPDVLYVWPSGRSSGLHQNRLLKDIGPFIEREGLAGVYLPAALDPANQYAGYVAMLPVAITASHVFYVNLEVLKDCGLAPAKTYSELKAQVPVLKAKGYETVIMANKDSWVMQSCLFSMLAGRFGGPGWEKAILSGEAKFTDPDFVNALGFVKTLYNDGVLSVSSLGVSYGDTPGLFSTNKGAYMIDGDWRVGAFVTDQSTGQALISPEQQKNILITVFPDIESAKLNRSTSGILGAGFAMSAAVPDGSEKEEAAWKLIKWLVGLEVETRRVEVGGIATPTRTDIDYAALVLEPMQIAAAGLGGKYNIQTAVIDGVFHSDIFNPLNDGLAEIGMGTKTPVQVAREIQRVFDAWKESQ